MIVPRFAVAYWKSKYFVPGRFRPDPGRDAQWNRGAYLAGALAHCSACHTPRDKLGGEKKGEYMSGGEAGGWHAPALNDRSPSPVPWNVDSLVEYLSTGLTDGHAITAGPMEGVVDNLGRVPREEVRAIAAYTAALDSRSRQEREKHLRDALAPLPMRDRDRAAASGAIIYAGACGDCHDRGRDKEGGALPLQLAIGLSLPTPANLIHITRDGILPKEHEAQRWMPEFGTALTEEQIADLAAYLRTLTDKPAWQDLRAEVRRLSQGRE
jgi:mono/diheme cytochrome c family protein